MVALSCACAIAVAGAAPAAADEVGDFQGTWVDRALDVQYELGFDVPLRNAPYVGTHNSFNSVAEMGPALSAMDSNQQLGLVDQLDVDVRSIELDLHRLPSAQDGDYRPVVCHALGGGVGCTVEKELDPILAEISAWLREPENSEQVLLLYLEDDLETEGTHDDAAEIIEAELGDLVYRPETGGCEEVSSELTRDGIRDSGKQVLIVSGCGKGDAWQSLAFSWEDHRESRPFDFEDFPDCGPDYTITDSRAHLIRYFEDSTRVSKGTGVPDDGLIPETVAAMVRCGIDLVGLDQLEPFDGRLEGLVWSWAPEQPSTGRCATNKFGAEFQFGRWFSKPCASLRGRPACRKGDRWIVPRGRSDLEEGIAVCEELGARLAAPRSGYENQLLRLAMAKRGARSAMLGLRLNRDAWTALDPRGKRKKKG